MFGLGDMHALQFQKNKSLNHVPVGRAVTLPTFSLVEFSNDEGLEILYWRNLPLFFDEI